MAVILEQTLPDGFDIALLDEVTAEMGVHQDPPPGLIVHVHFEDASQIRVVDVWGSAEAFETFQRERLMPTFQKVLERKGVTLDASMQPEMSLTEVATIVRGK